MSFKPILTRAVPAALLAASFLCWNLSSVAAANRSSAELVAVIQSPDASDHDKAVACEELAAVGDVESIAPLVSLLGDPKFSHYARFALQANPDPAAGEALRDALDRVEGLHLAGVVNTLAARRDLQAVPQLAKLIGSDDRQVAVAAAGALATIGGQDALAALTQSPQARDADFADAMLTAAIRLARDGRPDGVLLLDQIRAADFPQQVRQAAALALVRFAAPDEAEKLTRELLASQLDWEFEAGLQAAVQTDRSGLGAVLAEAFGDTTVARQIRLLAAITAKGDPAALDAVRAAASHQDPKVREAAVAALGTLGELADAPLLVRLALEDPKCGPVARESLGRIRDEQLDGYLLTTLETAEPAQQMLAADLIGQRRIKAAAPSLLELARSSENADVRTAALEATRRLAPGEMLAGLLDLVANAHTPEEKELARLAAIAAATRVADRNAAATTVAERLKTWPTPERGILLDMLRAIGGAQSLELVAVAAQAPERDTQDHATRVLGAWPTSDAAPVLLNLANSNHPFSARALRGYLRIARQLNVGEEERIAMCRRALEIANRDDARLLALSILELSPSKTSLELAASQLASDKLGPQASEAVINIAEAVAAGDPGAAQAAARQVVEVGAGDEVLARAHKLAAP